MVDRTERQKADKSAQAEGADKAALEATPDEGRMGALAKKLMATKPDRQNTGERTMAKRKSGVGSQNH